MPSPYDHRRDLDRGPRAARSADRDRGDVDVLSDVVVLVGGDPVEADAERPLPAGATVIAADSGLAAAAVLGLDVDLVVGDLDSVDPVDLADAERAGVPIDRHPVAKDRTDLAIALDAALRYAPARVVAVGGAGGRLDHLLGNAQVLASEAYRDLRIVAHVGRATITVVRDHAELVGHPDELVSLLPVHGPASGVSTDGLRFPLHGEDLPAGTTRGISNQFVRDRARVEVALGVVLAVQPGELGPPATDGAPT
jgi:thiamine pyrophosphokinase